MEQLQQACIRVIPASGRPAGWCDHIARMWPVDEPAGEHGAFYLVSARFEHKMIRRFWLFLFQGAVISGAGASHTLGKAWAEKEVSGKSAAVSPLGGLHLR